MLPPNNTTLVGDQAHSGKGLIHFPSIRIDPRYVSLCKGMWLGKAPLVFVNFSTLPAAAFHWFGGVDEISDVRRVLEKALSFPQFTRHFFPAEDK